MSQLTMATQTVQSNAISRPLAKYHPNVWGDIFLLSDVEYNELIMLEDELSPKVGALIKEVKIQLKKIDECHLKQVKLIDTIQRLGLEYHFEEEVDQVLQNIFDNYLHFVKYNNDLYSISMSFRLLRQHGHKVSCDVFEKFKDDKGEFKTSITSDVMGMLEFYEATYLSIKGEDILDKGRAFARTHLKSILPNISDSSISERVFQALDYSNRRGLPRLETRKYISIYEQHESCNGNLLLLAKLDFNRLQSLHKRELSEAYSWWTSLNVSKNFPYARDRCVETYFWALGIYFEPKYSIARKYLSRVLPLLSLLDDTYDAYGTFEELQIFTEAVERWITPESESLPGYMEVLYKAIWEIVEEIENETAKVGGEYRARYGKEVIKKTVLAFFDEAKWREEKYNPSTTEYLSVATTSSAYTALTVVSYIGMGDIATKEVFEWLLTAPTVIQAANIICRLTDDMVGYEFEKEREHIPSSVECYMKEHGVSKHDVVDEFNKRIELAWMDINEAFLRPTKFPAPLLHRILNFSRIIEIMYRKGDWYTHVGLEMQNYVHRLLIDPIRD